MPSEEFVYLWSQYINEGKADAVALAIVIYDYLITLEDEIVCFWILRKGQSMSAPAVLFFLSRYWAILVVLLNALATTSGGLTHVHFCQTYFQYFYYNPAMINIFLVQLIMGARVCGMYSNRTAMVVLLSMLACMSFVTSIVILNSGAATYFSGPGKIETDVDCLRFLAGDERVSNWTVWLPVLMFDYCVFALAIRKSTIFLRQQPHQTSLGTRLIRVMMRDSITYFIIILALYTANAWTWGHKQAGIFQNITVAINSVISSRMLINIRKEAAREGRASDNTVVPPRDINRAENGLDLLATATSPSDEGVLNSPSSRRTGSGSLWHPLSSTVNLLLR